MSAALQTTQELVTWTPAGPASLPDADLTVHVTLAGDDEPTWLGYWDGQHWINATTGGQFFGTVVAWAPTLKGALEC